MSDQGARSSAKMESSLGSSQVGSSGNNNDDLSQKPVTFAQKEAMVTFIMEHRELALDNDDTNELWKLLTEILNNAEGASRSSQAWIKYFKSWSSAVLQQRNKLNLTLLELQFWSFLNDLEKDKAVRDEFTAFMNSINNNLTSDCLSTVMKSEARFTNDEIMQVMMFELQDLEVKEKNFKFEIDSSTINLSDLLNAKQDLETQIKTVIDDVEINETHFSEVQAKKSALFNQIRNYVMSQYI